MATDCTRHQAVFEFCWSDISDSDCFIFENTTSGLYCHSVSHTLLITLKVSWHPLEHLVLLTQNTPCPWGLVALRSQVRHRVFQPLQNALGCSKPISRLCFRPFCDFFVAQKVNGNREKLNRMGWNNRMMSRCTLHFGHQYFPCKRYYSSKPTTFALGIIILLQK